MINETQRSSVSAPDAPRKEKVDQPEPGFQDIFSALAGAQQLLARQVNNNIVDGWTQSNGHSFANAPQEIRPTHTQEDTRVDWNTRGDARQPVSRNSDNGTEHFQLNQKTPGTRNSQEGARVPAKDASDNPAQGAGVNPSSRSDRTGNTDETSQAQNSSDENTVDNTPPTANATDDSDKIAQKLKDLGLDEEQIKKIMASLNNETQTGLKELLNILSELQSSTHITPDLSQDIASRRQFLSQLNTQENSIQNTLVQAGLSQADAKNLLDRIKTDVENSLQMREALNSNTRGVEITKLPQAEIAAVAPATSASDQGVVSVATNNSDKTSLPGNTENKKVSFGNSMDTLSRFGFATQSDHASDAKNKVGDTALFSRKNSEAPTEASDRLLDIVSTPITNTHDPRTNDNTLQQNIQSVSDSVLKTPEAVKITQDTAVQNIASVTDLSTRTTPETSQAAPQELSAARDVEKPIVNQIIEKFSLRGNGQQNEISIRLDPPDLGTVRINITSSGDSVKTTLIAENHAVKQVIENNLNHLRDAMSDQGLTVESFTVLVGGNQGQKGQNQPQQNGMNPVGIQFPESSTSQERTAGTPSSSRPSFYSESQSISVFA